MAVFRKFSKIQYFDGFLEDGNMKFESGTGWPRFFETLPGVFETKTVSVLGVNK